MRKRFTALYATVLFLLFLISGCDTKSKIATVDINGLLANSPLAQQEQKRLEEVKKILLQANLQAQEKYKDVTDRRRTQEAQQADTKTINMLWTMQQKAAREAVMDEVRSVINEIQQKEGYAVVIDKTNVVAAEVNVEITNKALVLLKDVKVDFGPLPQITIKAIPPQDPRPVTDKSGSGKK
ncbi:OmpH family outer membrane protein [Intestinirhabdus alba]|jgi:Skp family chaperone for outer membrane proteins|uniref:Chaperone protein Skp n=1 Tax=Intestinirhabdus alba TaxID=2899544 RepID=A0A6L6IJ85_9ENTR|nr:OmpH family outer membrane protein [Intestinirhabdus alba]MTH46195.1 hypothetical protein [Intestinirhabdus alba]